MKMAFAGLAFSPLMVAIVTMAVDTIPHVATQHPGMFACSLARSKCVCYYSEYGTPSVEWELYLDYCTATSTAVRDVEHKTFQGFTHHIQIVHVAWRDVH